VAKEPSVFNNVEKSLVRPPAAANSLEEAELLEKENDLLATGEQQLEIEIEEDDEGGAVINFGSETEVIATEFDGNLAEVLSDRELSDISSYVTQSHQDDKSSREDWEDTYSKGLDLLGLRYEIRTEPFQGATGVIHPILNEAVTQFQSAAYKELLPSNGPVKTKIIGKVNQEIENKADRVKEFLNYQIMYEMEEYEPEFDQMLYYLGNAGSAFKKVYFDQQLNRPVSKFVPAEDLVVPYTATDLRSADRVTHEISMSMNEARKQQVSGFFRDIELMPEQEGSEDSVQEKMDKLEGVKPSYNDKDRELTLLECHCYLDLEDFPDVGEDGEPTGVKLPYIVTVCRDNAEVLAVRRNYMQDDPKKTKIEYFAHYKFTPGLGFYGFGLIHLLGNLSRTATSTLRQMIDAGTLSNLPAGFKARGLRIADDENPVQPGEFRDVDVPGGDLKGALLPLPYKEPSGTLFQLMGFVIASAEKFVGTQDLGFEGNQSGDMPVGTTVALLERGSKVISAVHKRLHAAMRIELKLLAKLFSELAPEEAKYPYAVDGQQAGPQGQVGPNIFAQDFSAEIDVLPVSDPNIFSMSQRIMLAQEQLKLAMAMPEMHNMYESFRRLYSALGVDNIDELLKRPPDPVPVSPAVENGKAPLVVTGGAEPPKAFPEQDHDAHIAAHLAFLQTKVVKESTAIYAVILEHIYQHIGFKAEMMVASEMQQQGMQPNPQQKPMIDAAIAQKIAQLTAEFNEMEKEMSGGEQQDPLVALKQRELDIKAGDLARKQQDDQRGFELDNKKLTQAANLQRERIESQEDIAQLRANVAMDKTYNAPRGAGQ